ncbi:MAG: ferric reductase-like transmembrane domain-containing protein [Gammaproteobacteria bacterium]|nr:ferric reductase-like transmembrane domain-containing protein [Gammaproteobacteria bacterium]
MNVVLQFVRSRYFFWAVLGFPFIATVTGYRQGRLFYGEVVQASGEMSARLLILALLATPLLLMFPDKAFPRWLKKNRRYLGVASFAYAALHTLVYLEKTGWWLDILDDAKLPDYWTGWVALFIFLILAATSNDRSVRWLKHRWKKLHRFIYAAAILLFVHWVLVAFNRGPAIAHLSLLGAIEGYRIWKLKHIAAPGRSTNIV